MVATRRSTTAAAAAAAVEAEAGASTTPPRPTTPRRKSTAAAAAAAAAAPSPAVALALVAGALGALAAAFGKLSGQCQSSHLPAWLASQQPLACRASLLLLLVACNAAATALALRALALELPSLQATVLGNASNLAATGALGALLFGEPITARWAVGVATVGAGLWLISRAAAGAPAAGAPAAGRRQRQRATTATPAARQPRQRRSG
jgi:hypothetical protein